MLNSLRQRSLVIIAVGLSLVLASCDGGSEDATSIDDKLNNKPKLAVNIVVDGLSMETPMRYWQHLSDGGFKRFFREGAWFSNAHHRTSGTWTGQGHPTILTGAYPSTHGILSDGWVDRETGQLVEPYLDTEYPVLGLDFPARYPPKGYSPLQLEVTNVPDELRRATNFRSKVISIAANDKAAIAHAGRLGTAYWLQGASPPFDFGSEQFVTSTYYMDSYPKWWQDFHEGHPANAYFGAWTPLYKEDAYSLAAASPDLPYFAKRDWLGFGTTFPHRVAGGLETPGPEYYVALAWSPFAHDFTVDFANAAIRGENLGKNSAGVPDFLSVGFPSYDFIKHVYGPESRETLDAFYRTDRALEKLLDELDQWVGLENALVSLTTDHGPGTDPDFANQRLGFKDAARLDVPGMLKSLEGHLQETFGKKGKGKYILNSIVPFIYLDYDFISRQGRSRTEVENEAAAFLSDFHGVHSVFTRTQLRMGQVPDSRLGQQVLTSWNSERGGDLYIIQKPFWYYWDHPEIEALGAMHGSPWSYDTHVPVAFLGEKWIVPGEYTVDIDMTDIAPTFSHILRVLEPSGSSGQVLQEMLRS